MFNFPWVNAATAVAVWTKTLMILEIIISLYATHRAASADTNTPVMNAAEGDPNLLIAISFSSFGHLVKMTKHIYKDYQYKARVTHTIPIRRIVCVSKDKLLVGRTPLSFCRGDLLECWVR